MWSTVGKYKNVRGISSISLLHWTNSTHECVMLGCFQTFWWQTNVLLRIICTIIYPRLKLSSFNLIATKWRCHNLLLLIIADIKRNYATLNYQPNNGLFWRMSARYRETYEVAWSMESTPYLPKKSQNMLCMMQPTEMVHNGMNFSSWEELFKKWWVGKTH